MGKIYSLFIEERKSGIIILLSCAFLKKECNFLKLPLPSFTFFSKKIKKNPLFSFSSFKICEIILN
ncbi:MAG: hypothetical protein C6I01_04030 [Epsilonproteobacteria bacterium]|nr:hypothetical protein [Campylobacterota bacterium]NPA89528.1 hypothetical protein [Campylobacterota bacterium]